MLEFQTLQLFPILQAFFWFLNCSKKQKTGSQEVSGSIPLISTTKNLEAAMASRFFPVYGKLHKAVFVLNYKFFAISFIRGRCLVTPRRCRPPWCLPEKSYLHSLIGKAGRYPIENIIIYLIYSSAILILHSLSCGSAPSYRPASASLPFQRSDGLLQARSSGGWWPVFSHSSAYPR